MPTNDPNEKEPQGAREPQHVGADDDVTAGDRPEDAERDGRRRSSHPGGLDGRSFAGTSFAANEREQTEARRGETHTTRFDATGSGEAGERASDES